MLLTFAIPHLDVKPLAKQLIAHFGTLSRVLDAAPEALIEVQGIRDYSAVLIRLTKAFAEYYLKEEVLARPRSPPSPPWWDYCRTSNGGPGRRAVPVIFLNSQNEIIAAEIVQEGTVNQTVVYPRKVRNWP